MITVVTPTFRRPDGLRRAIRSLFAQTGISAFAIVVVDNDPAASAADAIADLNREAPAHIRFTAVHEPDAGVANARNRAMEATETDLVVFLDDDQSAPDDWLSTLLDFHARHPAPATFGPVETDLPDGITRHHAYLDDFFSRRRDGPSGYIDRAYGAGNCMLDRRLLPPLDPLFDTTMNETGGEDDVLFNAIDAEGGRFAWCAQAPVYEHVPARRATLSYTLNRAMSYGQGPCTYALKRERKRWDLLALWVCIGAAKAALHGSVYAVRFLVRDPKRAFSLDRAARGFGKVVWWKAFNLYGAAALNATHSAEVSATPDLPLPATDPLP